MKYARRVGFVLFMSGIAATSLLAQVRRTPERLPPPLPQSTPKFEALAETKLLMEGLTQPNYRALEKHLQGNGPQDLETWAFARGQALLVAETGNLLLLRPPRNDGREVWMRRAADMRQSAGELARRMGNRELARSRTALLDLTDKCNACHRTFRVPTRVGPKLEPENDRRDTN